MTNEGRMIIFFSGDGCTKSDPERLLKEKANIMLTYNDSHGKPLPEKRMYDVWKSRKRAMKHTKKGEQ